MLCNQPDGLAMTLPYVTDISTPDSLLLAHRRSLAVGTVKDLVDSLLGNDERVESIASLSYEHANGFDKLVLDLGPGWKLRFHYWPEKEANLDDLNIHNHRWDFASSVVLGELKAYYYDVHKDTLGNYDFYRYSSPEMDNWYDFQYLGKVTAAMSHEESLPTGSSYGLGHTRSHRVSVITAPAATLVLQGPVRKDSTRVVRAPDAEQVTTDVTRMDPEKVYQLLKTLRRCL
jgi:hypothetical protein